MTIYTNYVIRASRCPSASLDDFKPIKSRLFFRCNPCKHVTCVAIEWTQRDRLNRTIPCECGEQELIIKEVPLTLSASCSVMSVAAKIEVTGKFRVFYIKHDEETEWSAMFGLEKVIFNTNEKGDWQMTEEDYELKKPKKLEPLDWDQYHELELLVWSQEDIPDDDVLRGLEAAAPDVVEEDDPIPIPKVERLELEVKILTPWRFVHDPNDIVWVPNENDLSVPKDQI